MKLNFLRNLTIGGSVLLSLLCSDAWATGYYLSLPDNTITADARKYCWAGWGKTPVGGSAVYAKQIAVSNGVIYSSVPTEDHFVYYNPITGVFTDCTTDADGVKQYNVNPTTAAGNASAIGRAVVTDDAGNIVYAAGCGYNTKVTYINVLPKTANRGEVIDPAAIRSAYKHKGYDLGPVYTTVLNTFAVADWGRTDYYHASGNLMEGNGALWFTDGFTVVKVPIVDGVPQKEVLYDIPDTDETDSKNVVSHVTSSVNQWWYQSQFRPYADGKYLLQNANGLFDCTISSGKLKCTKIDGASAYVGATIGYLKDHEILVYCKNDRDALITVYDRTVGIEIGTIQAIGDITAFCDNMNVWCETEVIDENTLGIYTNVPGMGVARILLTATTDGTAFTATIAKRADSNYQDVTLSWGTIASKTSATVQYRKRYVKDGATYYTNWSNVVAKTTETTCTHSNVYWYNDSEGFYPTVVEYRVIGHYENMTQKDKLLTLTAEVTPQLIPKSIEWDLNEIVEYPGYQKVQLFWNVTGTGSTPKYFNIYRDGEKINPNPVQVYNYIDEQVPAGNHEYYVEAFVSNEIETLKTTTKPIYVNPRNPMKTTYTIEKIYNYRIGTGANMVKPTGTYGNLASGVRYKQGVYYQGNWYLAKQNYGTDTNNDGEVTKADEIYGGVIKFSADNQKIISETGTPAFNQYQVQSSWVDGIYSAGISAGLAMDDAGNIFVRESGEYPKGTTKQSIVFSLGKGRIYLRNADGTYNNSYLSVDLTGCNLHDLTGSRNSSYTYYGRVDYYSMSGDLSEVGGTAYLYVSSHLGVRSNRIKLTRTADGITAEDDYVDITINSSNGTAFQAEPSESYAFPVKYLKKGTTTDGVTSFSEYRDDNLYIHNSRSNGYFAVNPSNDAQKIIYETYSRKQNAGGCTIGFNGELFVITPQSVYSQNTGHFIVSMADRTKYDANGDPVKDGNNDVMLDIDGTELDKSAALSNVIPVSQYTQTDIDDGSYSDANGNWLYAVHGTIEGENEVYDGLTSQNHDCVYIYQYVPGVRFAKYRLIPNNYFPPTPVDLVLNTRYSYATDEEGNIKYEDSNEVDENGNVIQKPVVNDITGFDGVVKWQKPVYDQVGGGNINYEHYSYTLVITDKDGHVIDKREIAVDAAVEAENGYYTIEYPFDNANGGTVQTYNGKDVVFMPNEDETAQPYYAYLTVNYRNTSDTNEKQYSDQTSDEDEAGYEGVGATGTVTVLKGSSTKINYDEDYKPVTESSIYRIDVNVDEPDFAKAEKTEEPVSHYEIWVDKGDGKGYVQVTDFNLMQGEEGKYTPVTDGKIPGDYDFAANEAYSVAGSESENNTTKSTLHFYEYGTPYEYGTEAPADDINPADWKYKVVTVYASTTEGVENRDISQSLDSSMAATLSNVPTGIENVVAGDGLRLYPIPVNTLLTIDSPEAVETIVIYNNMGVVVKSINCGGEYSATVNVEELATGMYFVSVNNAAPVKIIKK